MMRYLAYSLVPLLVLVFAAMLAGVAGYFMVLLVGDLSLQKVINKITQVFLVLGIFPAMAYLKINKTDLGFAERPLFFKQVLQGFGLGLLTLLPVFIILYGLDITVIDPSQSWTLGWLAEKTVIALLLALLISLLEEPLFRGILFVGLSRKLPVVAAIAISAMYYAALHFIKTKTEIPAQDITLSSGFYLMAEAFANLLNPDIFPALLALLMVGMFLGLLRTQVKTGLGLCIGCHTAWVWQIKMSKTLFNTDYSADYAYLVSHYDGVVGPLVTVWLMLAVAGYLIYLRISKRSNCV
ncbi:MAG: CPBP family glutamic-type intramembrane protease [Methylovulum sp.]|nr:CPBP family glutamic-type intramembrane protease [Methylovulum sp.]